jgi:hypothetical protein
MTKKTVTKRGSTKKGKKRAKKDPVVRYIFVLGGVVLALGLISLFFDILGRWVFTSIVLTVLSIGGFIWGNRLYEGGDGPSPALGGVVIFVSAVLLGLDIVSINKMLGEPLPTASYILFIATALYFTLAYIYDNHLILILALISLFGYLAYVGGGFWGWLPFFKGGVNSHIYIAVASPFVILMGYLHERFIDRPGKKSAVFEFFSRTYYFIGFLFLNTSLWMLSLFGRNPKLWPENASQSREELAFTILFFLANIATVVFGGVKRDRTFITFGAIFLTINIFTRFSDVFFEDLGSSATFIIAGGILIALGLILEKMLRKK